MRNGGSHQLHRCKRMKTVTWYIFNVLGKKKHVSPTFIESGFEWHIEAYPNGIDETCKGCDLAR